MQQSPPRPRPVRVRDELGLMKTLPGARADFLPLFGAGPDVLFLGLGPQPERLAELFPELLTNAGVMRYVEAPDLASQLEGQVEGQIGADWRGRIPAGYAEISAADAIKAARDSRVILYRPGPRLFPGFFGPLLARLQVERFKAAPAPSARIVWLPGDEKSLLRLELAEAFAALGFQVRGLAQGEAEVRSLLAGGERPALYFSVNFRGLDPLGETAHLLRAAGSQVAVWCVDNPLHLVSGCRARYWLNLPLFVTDDWFLEPLRRLGATNAQHLPLAARGGNLQGPPRQPSPSFADLAERLVFVGRSAFPDKDGFFAGCTVPAAAWTEAERLLTAGQRPDFGWWLMRLGIEKLWPGSDVRRAGFCAEETGRAWRSLCLNRAIGDLGGAVTVFGPDEEVGGWRELLAKRPEGPDLRGPVDYYAALPGLCASAGCCLNLTSPLLPHGLTQRHFDTWAWGGLLLTDATPGLALFPAELTREITFRTPEDIAPRLRSLRASASGAEDLKSAWRAELAARHTYGHRVRQVLDAVGLS